MKVARTVLRGATLGNKCRLLDRNELHDRLVMAFTVTKGLCLFLYQHEKLPTIS